VSCRVEGRVSHGPPALRTKTIGRLIGPRFQAFMAGQHRASRNQYLRNARELSPNEPMRTFWVQIAMREHRDMLKALGEACAQ
jgi:hypothetical protein